MSYAPHYAESEKHEAFERLREFALNSNAVWAECALSAWEESKRFAAALETDINKLDECAQQLRDALKALVPPKNCSCHTAPPCFDCTEYGFAREALENYEKLNE